ncbi:MAG: hemolysin family protein [Candidatus Limnocylindrales bacterium]
MNPLLELVVVAVLVACNAIFVAAEIALVTIRRSRVDQLVEDGHPSARRLDRLLQRPGRFLAVTQLGITFIGFLASAFAAVSLTEGLRNAFAAVPALAPLAAALALVIVTALLALVTIVFGELVPKAVALAHAERFALAVAGPFELLERLLGPLVRLLEAITNAIARPLGGEPSDPYRISMDELKILVERGGEQGVLEAEEEQMLSAVIELGEGRVHQVMVPRTDVTAIPVDTPLGEAVDTILREGHSRIPVYEESIDNVVGILYAKDLLPYLKDPSTTPELRRLLRTPLFVPESMSVDDLLHELQRRKVHMAIVLDEYGGTAGIVTIEDLLEEIVGEIQDEYDTEEPMVERISDDQVRFDGRANIDDFVEAFGLDLEDEDREEYDTVGGLVYHRVGGVPRVGDQIEVGSVLLTVESTDGRRVGKVLAVRHAPEEVAPGAEGG